MTATEQYIDRLTSLKIGDLGILRTFGNRSLDESTNAFDLFTGLWWPLRKDSSKAPRREVAWLIAKCYAFAPLPNFRGARLARAMRRHRPMELQKQVRFEQKFDELLISPIEQIEPRLQWAISHLAARKGRLDWVALTDDLSFWQREETRRKWVDDFLAETEREEKC